MAALRDMEVEGLRAALAAAALSPHDVDALAYLRAYAVATAVDQRRVGMAKTSQALDQAVAVLDRLIGAADSGAKRA
jgi:hypothetical protein